MSLTYLSLRCIIKLENYIGAQFIHARLLHVDSENLARERMALGGFYCVDMSTFEMAAFMMSN